MFENLVEQFVVQSSVFLFLKLEFVAEHLAFELAPVAQATEFVVQAAEFVVSAEFVAQAAEFVVALAPLVLAVHRFQYSKTGHFLPQAPLLQ